MSIDRALSFLLASNIFVSAIAVHVQHSQCIFFAGTFEPAYIITVSALPSYILPAHNKRNTLVLTEHLEEALGVPQQRGFISFMPIPEENIACNGRIVAAALDETLEDPAGYAMGVIQEDKTTSFGSRRRRLSVKVSFFRTFAHHLQRGHSKKNGSFTRDHSLTRTNSR